MNSYVALLRAVNVGGTGKLPMDMLKQFCDEAGFGAAKTYIASGNVVFTADQDEAAVKAALEARLAAFAGKAVPIFVRTAKEMAAVRDANPFSEMPGNKVVAVFLHDAPSEDIETNARHVKDERVAMGRREIYIAYPGGMGTSRLVVPAAGPGTARNMNTVAKLAEMAAAL